MVIKRYSAIGFIIVILFLFIGIVSLYTGSFPLFLWDFQKPKPYNVIMISIDTLRADHLGAYGYSRDTSPNLDRFAEEGIMFEQAIAQAPYTLSSQASILTSQYPSVHGVLGLESTLPPSKVTLTEVLSKYGFETAAFVGGGELRARFGFTQGFDTYIDTAGVSFNTTIPLAVEWIKKQKSSRFFVYVQGYDVHGPYHYTDQYKPTEYFEHMFDPEYDGILSDHTQFYFDYDLTHPNAILHLIKKVDGKIVLELEDEIIPLAQRDIDHIIAHYDGGIRYTDNLIQQFLDTLKELGVYDNSIIVIFAAHGESLADSIERPRDDIRRLMGHGQVYEELIHVPLFIKHPTMKAQKITTQVQLIDLFPTLLDFLNIPFSKELKEEIQGESLVPLINGTADEYFNEYTYGEVGEGGQSSFVRTAQWKLVRWGEQFELYNLQDDPKEARNTIEQYPDVAKKLKKSFFEWSLKNFQKQSQ